MKIINVIEFNKIMQSEDEFFLLDVRTEGEYAFANIKGENIPLDTLQDKVGDLPKDRPIYCLCHHGVRSAHAANFLIHSGFEDVYNIDGGIDAWSEQVDPKIKKY